MIIYGVKTPSAAATLNTKSGLARVYFRPIYSAFTGIHEPFTKRNHFFIPTGALTAGHTVNTDTSKTLEVSGIN